jgi:cellulose synthase operon protein C
MNKTRLSAVTLALVIGLSACSQKTAEEYLSNAQNMIAEGKDKAAVVELKNALSQAPDMGLARLLLGELYFHQNDFVTAEKELLRAMEHLSDVSRVVPLLARTYYYQGNYTGVMALYEQQADIREDAAQTTHLFAYISSLRSSPEARNWLTFPDNLTADNLLIARAYRALVEGKLREANDAIAGFSEEKLQVEKDFLQGLVAFREGRFEDAAGHYSDVLTQIDNLHPVRFQLVEAQINARQLEQADENLDRLLKLSKENPYANLLKSKLRFIQQDFDNALPFAEKAIQNGMDIKLAQIIAGVSAYKLRQLESAYRYLTRAASDLGKGHDVHRLLAQVQLMLGYTDEARLTLDELDVLSEADAGLFAEAGLQVAGQGDLTTAGEYLSRASEADQNNARFKLTEGLVKLAGEDESGIADIEAALANDSSLQEGWVLLAETYLDKEQKQKAIEVAKQWQLTDAASGMALEGLIELKSGDTVSAEQALLAALKQDKQHLGASHYLVQLYKQQDKPQKALEYVNHILSFAPANFNALTDLVRIKQQSEQSEDIIPALSSHHEQYPELAEPKWVLAEYLRSVNQPEKAIEVLGTDLDSLQATGMMILGDAYVQTGRYNEARDVFARIREDSPGVLGGWLRSAGIEELTGQYEKALDIVNQALERFPDHSRLLLLKVNYLTKTNQLEAARQVLGSARNSDADTALLARLEGELALSAKRYLQAEQKFRDFYQARPGFEAASLLAIALQNTDKVPEAATLLETEFGKLPRPMMEYHTLAEFYTNNGMYSEAEQKYEQFLQRYPGHFPSLNNYANLKIKQQQYEQALILAKQAQEAAPQVPQVMDTLGWSYYKTGDIQNAERLLKEAARKLPADINVQMNLAEILVAAGDAQSAFSILQKLEPQDKQQSERLQRLKAKVGGMG